jgi:nickel-dependent lactate racemase
VKIHLAYGKDGLDVELPDHADVLTPTSTPALPDPRQAIAEAIAAPIGSPPLSQLLHPSDSVAVVFSDITRPTPNAVMLGPILEAIAAAAVPREQIVLVNGTGMHRLNSEQELDYMLGPDILRSYRIVQHVARDRSTLAYLSKNGAGVEAWVNSDYMRADVKILTGFVEPHIFAGYSGGGKAVLPGIAGADIVMHNHGAAMLSHPKATWCQTKGNPVFEEMRDIGLATRPTFLMNVTLNEGKEITGVFAGDMVAAHDAGIAQAARQALRPVPRRYDIVVGTHMGYPADINLYQSVKAISVASQAVKTGGTIVVATECADGLGHSDFEEVLAGRPSPQELLEMISAPGYSRYDQWGVQCMAMVQTRADVYLYSSLSREQTKTAHLHYCEDVAATVEGLRQDFRRRHSEEPSIAVLPYGHLTVPQAPD